MTDATRSHWVPPFFACGECGGEIGRYPMLNLLRQQILDWRHRTVPDGIGPHRAVLGTPAHRPAILSPVDTDDRGGDDDGPEQAPAPIVPARPALREDLPRSALLLDKLADEHGWQVQAFFMRGTLMDARWKASRVISSVVLWFDQPAIRLVATWRTKTDDVTWEFDAAWSLGHGCNPLTSSQLRTVIKLGESPCVECGEISALHHWTESGLVCHSDETQPQGGTP